MTTKPMPGARPTPRLQATASPPPDPADMGCCLGLELSHGAVMPPQPELVAAPPASSDRLGGWWRRMHPSKAAHA